MKLIRTIYMLGLLAGLFVSCSKESPLDGEQYYKQVYIVGAYEVVQQFDVAYGDGPQNAYVAVAAGGSQNIDRNLEVVLAHNDATIEWYNNKYMLDAPLKYQKLDDQFCSFPSMKTTIKAGEVYSRLPFTVETSGLDCDKLYALTFKIESVSDYVKHPKDTVLIMNLNLTNDFSGTYQMVAIRYTLTANDEELTPSSVNMQRTLKAVSKDQARFFNVTQSSDLSATGNVTTEEYFNVIDNNGVTFTRQPDGTFTVAGWKNLSVSNGTVSFEDGTFTFCYDYESGGKRYRLRGTMTK
ncbi:BT_3044 domain-containing protein [Bacteroides thetaiotaomicron]|uniref:Domain of uncharacterized function (DUF1735) n=1 Tax=Bacteroides thetaiotaomicron TaxID=818 RepID=A0A174VAH5_BACT4|nr:DUF4361 domain-containing protein [Bacteroides thetaiotaomicron]CUQ31592.1 Domain of uncharacterised function (DUF1735) [Bacteroides thetaiotaomicron]